MANEELLLEKTRRERKKIEQRRVLLAVARALFEKKGYENTVMDEIAENADVSRSTLFNYFINKESILNALFEEEAQDLVYYLNHDLKGKTPVIEKIYLFFQFWVEDTIGFKNTVGRALINGMAVNRKIYDGYLSACRDLVSEAQKAKEIDASLNPMAVANLLTGVYYAIIINAAANDEKTGSLVTRMLDMVFKGIAT